MVPLKSIIKQLFILWVQVRVRSQEHELYRLPIR